MERLYAQFRHLLERTKTKNIRYLHDEINWENRLSGIVGPRGVGKTTMLLQHIKLYHNIQDTLYVSMDDFYFSENRLYQLADIFSKKGGKYLFLDEIHKYAQWSKDLKMIYDNIPELTVVFTGSSILDIYKGSDDLSRRALTYYMQGLSFREYLNISKGLELTPLSLDDILANKTKPGNIKHPIQYFQEYLKNGYYPFFKEPGYTQRLNNVINLSLETDIPLHVNMNVATTQKLKKLLFIISRSVPFKPNFTKIADMIGIHRNQVVEFLHYFEKAGLIRQLRTETGGLRLLGKIEKVYFDNTNLMYALSENKPNTGNLRETFFFNQMGLQHKLFQSPVADFKLNEYTFEIGGINKGQKQVKEIDKAFIVKDDIEYGYGNSIPLWTFGLNY
ncbi:MAG: ATP-binding protein [Bacteroidota bacterium]